MRTLNELTQIELEKLYLALELDKEESERQYPDLHISNGMRVEMEGNTLILDNDNNWGFAYHINSNGAMVAFCKDDNSERSYAFNCEAVIKLLYSMDVDLLNIKSWIFDRELPAEDKK